MRTRLRRLEAWVEMREAKELAAEFGVPLSLVIEVTETVRAEKRAMCAPCNKRVCDLELCTRRLAISMGLDPDEAVAEVRAEADRMGIP